MNRFSKYNRIILSLFSAAGIAIVTTATYMEPLNGDLTRIGGYFENDFGWNKPQEYFAKPLFKPATSIQDYDKYFDVVVLGDSFGDDLGHGWQNYFVEQTGLSVISFNVYVARLNEILSTRTYRETPPVLFIYESVERNVISRHPHCQKWPARNIWVPAPVFRQANLVSIAAEKSFKTRQKGKGLFNSIDFSASVNYLSKTIMRNLLLWNLTEVHQFRLRKPGLFSNKRNDRLLVITRDFQLKGVTDKEINLARCDLLNLQHRIQADGRTAFLFLIFPDKTTVYSDYLTDTSYAQMSILPQVEATEGLNVVALNGPFKEAIREGIVDLYLPNDTHCGFYGYKLAASIVVQALIKKGILTEGS